MPLSVNKVKIRLTQTYLGEKGVIGNSPEFH